MVLRVYLIRHGETEFNKKNKEWGQRNEEELNCCGIQQVVSLSKRLKDIKFDKIYSSDLTRAIQTAEIVSKYLDLEINVDKRLREYDPGEVDPSSEKWIQKYKELLRSGMSKYNIRPFGGENIWDLIKRVKSFFEHLEKENGIVAIVSHSGFNQAFINLAQGRDKDDFIDIKQDNACINVLEFSRKKWNIVTINDSRHLDDFEPKVDIYENQEEVKKLSREYLAGNLNNFAEEIYLSGDLVVNNFGIYDCRYKRYDGSPIEGYILLIKGVQIPNEWKISSIIDCVEKYEIGKIKFGKIKHKVNVSIIKDLQIFKKENMEKII